MAQNDRCPDCGAGASCECARKTVFIVSYRGKHSRPLATRDAARAFAGDLAGMGIVGEITEYAAELFEEDADAHANRLEREANERAAAVEEERDERYAEEG